ncbi:hypothetical protein CRG98_043124 [Punica granatum]|uniref:Uncharacterized protein n=1 Tax=Punica granatum TaxID=22663 RepID=A0A2I0HYZ8_PUNGR|nr:hypothetical protein CRG98_043124 [Punica granatum]
MQSNWTTTKRFHLLINLPTSHLPTTLANCTYALPIVHQFSSSPCYEPYGLDYPPPPADDPSGLPHVLLLIPSLHYFL